MVTQIQPQFKSEVMQPSQVNYNQRYTPPMPTEAQDMFIMQQIAEQRAAKKEKNKERWYKTGVGAQVALAAAFSVMAAASVFGLYKQYGKGAGDIVKNFKFEDFAKKEDFPKITDDCVNPKVREFIQSFAKKSGLKDSVKNLTGVQGDEQCLLMYGPSGTGKTFSAKLLAKELGAEYGEVQFADVSSPYVGQTSVEIKKVFEKIYMNGKKNPNKKYVIAFNEIDALLVPREKCGANNLHLAENRTAFLNGLDLIRELKNVKIVGTTNVDPHSGNLDKASLSRFANLLKIDLPEEKELIASLKFHLRNCKIINDQKFFETNKDEIANFAKLLKERKYSQRDVEDIAKKSIDNFSFAINEKANPEKEKFAIKYLEEAVNAKGATTGSLEQEVIPHWQQQNEVPEFMPKHKEKTKLETWIAKIKAYFNK